MLCGWEDYHFDPRIGTIFLSMALAAAPPKNKPEGFFRVFFLKKLESLNCFGVRMICCQDQLVPRLNFLQMIL